jgi:hypothetical protein
MAEAVPAAAVGGIGDILATAKRDFLVRNSGEQVSQPPPHSSLICLEAGYIDVQIRHSRCWPDCVFSCRVAFD